MKKNWNANTTLKAAIAIAFVAAFTGGIYLFAKSVKGAFFFMALVFIVMAAAVFAIRNTEEKESRGDAANKDDKKEPVEKETVSVAEKSADEAHVEKKPARAVVVLSEDPAGGGFSGMWLSALENAIGDAAAIMPSSIKGLQETASGAQVVVLPVKESEALINSAADMEALEAFAAQGRAVIIEATSKRIVELLGLRQIDGPAQSRISVVSPDIAGEEAAQMLEGFTGKIKNTCTEVPQGWFSSDMRFGGYPAVLSRRVGKGAVIALLFDYGELSFSLKQAGAGPRAAYKHPYADLFDEFIVAVAAKYVPLPVWHRQPGDAVATIVVACEDDFSTKRTGIVLKLLGDIGVRPSFFMLPGNKQSVVHSMAADIPEAGLMLDLRGVSQRSAAAGVSAGLDKLRKAAGDGPMRILRAVRFNMKCAPSMPKEAAVLFETAGVEADFSLSTERISGLYQRACGFPFRHIDATGRPAGIFEFTFQFSDKAAPAESEACDDFINDLKSHGGMAAVLIDPLQQIQSPAKRNSALYLLKKAKEEDLNICGAGSFIDWWKDRGRSAAVITESDGGVMVSANAVADGMRLVLQDRLRGAVLTSVTLDGSPAELSPDGKTIKLARGTHDLMLKYSV